MEVHCSAPPATKPKRSDIKMAEPMEIPAAGTSDDVVASKGEVEDKLRGVRKRLDELEKETDACVAKTERVEENIEALLKKETRTTSEQEQLAHLRKKEEALRKREEYLREKEKQLREEQKQLMDKEKQLREERLKDKDLQLARRRQSPTGEEPVQKKPRIGQSFWANIRSATEESKNDDDKSDEHDDKPEPDPEPELSSTSLLVFSDVIPHHDTNNQLYIRQAYIDIYEMYIEKNDFILVSGTPGVGKTIFSFYVLYRLLKAVPDASVLYASAKGNYAVYLEGDNVVVADNQEQFRECATYYMFDCGDGSKMQIDIGATSASRKTIVFSSPNKKHYKEYEKSFIYSCERKGVIVYMPPWSLMELQFCRRHLFSYITSEGLERRYNLWGGVPRVIFNISESNGERLLRGLIVTNSLKGIMRLATSIHAGQFDSVSHRILHLHVEKDKDRVNYDDPIVTFASKWVAQQVYDHAECESVLSLTNVMSNAAKHTPLQGLCGQIFESFCHAQLSSGRTFTVKSLTSETTIPKVWKCSKRDTFRDLMEAELSENTYYVPENPNFESVDAVVPPDTAVQITVSLKRPVKMRGLQYVKDALGCQELKLYFAVPENIYESFQKQPYHTQKGKEWKKT